MLFGSAAFLGGGVPAVIVAFVVDAQNPFSPFWDGVIGVLAVVLDSVARAGFRWARPLAVFRQVPRDYGYRFGPWRAALRYGLRMGFGPATILVSWVWWAAFVIGVASGVTTSLLGALTFALFRAVTMSVMAIGVRDGLAMAARSARIVQVERRAERATSIIVIGVSAFAIVWSMR